MDNYRCPDCGIRHDRVRYQARPDVPSYHFGCVANLLLQALLILVLIVGFVWGYFLLWPV